MTLTAERIGLHLTVNPYAVLLQSRLHVPAYAGPGKWVVFNGQTRKTFLASGPDVVPDAVRILAAVGSGAGLQGMVLEDRPLDAAVHRLLDAGLITRTEGERQSPSPTLLETYHRGVTDYPFHDYSDPEWAEHDTALMQSYSAVSPPPPLATERLGNGYELPPASPRLFETSDGCFSLESLATLLRYVFGPTGSVPWALGQCFKKTSPSGGARHPTEGVVLLPSRLGHVPPGAYAYDVLKHRLVVDALIDPGLLDGLEASSFGLLIRSRVERAMWRYRDIRALRPVLLDAGHVIETAALLAARLGMGTAVLSVAPHGGDAGGWLQEPPLALVVFGAPGMVATRRASTPPSQVAPVAPVPYLTNSTAYFTFDGPTGLWAHVGWPVVSRLPVTLDGFLAVNHCLPSKRGDRSTTPDGIIGAVPRLSSGELADLVNARILLPENIGQAHYHETRFWAKYGWYFSLLAYLDAVGGAGAAGVVARASVASPAVPADRSLLDTLLVRRTTRSFAPRPISRYSVTDILRFAAADLTSTRNVRILVAATDVAGLDPALYEWNFPEARLVGARDALDRDAIRALTIGQAPIASGAATIWVVREVDFSPARYLNDTIELGRLGQRICLAATAAVLGVFLTPAVCDSPTFARLRLPAPERSVTYAFALGVPKERHERPPLEDQ